VAAHDQLALVGRALSIVCFRVEPGDDALQSEVARRIQLGGEAFLTTAEVDGHIVLRACFINPLTTRADVDALAELVVRTASAASPTPLVGDSVVFLSYFQQVAVSTARRA